MAAIRQNALRSGGTTWSVLFRAPDEHAIPRQTSETFGDPAAAAEFLANIERFGPEAARAILDAHDAAGASPKTVAEQVADHIDALSGITDGVRQMYQRMLAELQTTRLGALPLVAVTRTDVARWIGDLERGVGRKTPLAGKTIGLHHQLLAAAFKRAVQDDLLTKSPATGARIPRTERREMVVMTPAEFTSVYDQIADEPWRILFHLLAGTGLRIGEALALKTGDLSLDLPVPTLRVARTWHGAETGRVLGAPKTNAGRRVVSIDPWLAAHLREHIKTLAAGDVWLFPNRDATEPVTHGGAYYIWTRAVAASGVGKKPRIHDIRHAHVSWMLAGGEGMDRVRQRVGHTSIKMTVDIYGQLMPDAHADMAATIGRALPVGEIVADAAPDGDEVAAALALLRERGYEVAAHPTVGPEPAQIEA